MKTKLSISTLREELHNKERWQTSAWSFLMHPEPQLLIEIVLNIQISSFCLGTRGQLAVCWSRKLRENVGRCIYSSPHFLCPGEKKSFEKKAFVASVICSTEIVQAEFSLFAVFLWKCFNCWVFKITLFRYFCSHNMRVKLTKECGQDNQPQLFVRCLIKCHFQLFITL